MTLSYCDIDVSWSLDGGQDLGSVFSYRISKSDGEDSDTDEAEVLPHCGYSRLFRENSSEPEPCLLTLTCKAPYNVSILSVTILSESRTQEAYDHSNIYLTTSTLIQTDHIQDGTPLYITQLEWDEPHQQCSIKFLSLGERSTFRVYGIVVELIQDVKVSRHGDPLLGHINMAKVKDMVSSMEGNLSDRAKAFMSTMEHYQQNQEKTLAGMESLLARSAPDMGEKLSGTGDMSGLLTMFTSLSQQKQRPPGGSNGIMPSLPLEPISLGKNGGIQSDSPPPMFSMLKDICGKVSELREEEVREKTEEMRSSECGANGNSPDHRALPAVSNIITCDDVEGLLLKHMEAMETRLTASMDEKLRAVEERVNQKLDQILYLLTRPSATPPGQYDTSDESSLSSSGELTLD